MLSDKPAIRLIVVALTSGCMVACSGDTWISREQARSELRSAHSFAAESELFIGFVLQGHATFHYASEHATYLKDAIERSRKELEHAIPESDANDVLRESQAKLSMLSHELDGVRAAIADDNKDALTAAQGRIRQIRKSLEKANSYL